MKSESAEDGILYVSEINDCIEAVIDYVNDISKEQFLHDRVKVDAVILRIGVIGETVKKLPSSVKAMCPNISWDKIAKMRDKVFHHYFGVDIDVVWKTATVRIPQLAACVRELLRKLEKKVPRG